MASQLDNLIMVGFKKPDEETVEGKKVYRSLMDIADVPRNGIHFIVGEPPILEIITQNFVKDDSQKFKYRIGNTLCIVSDSASDTYKLSLQKRLKKIGIVVKSGYQTVELEEINELEIEEWFQTGKYNKKETPESKNVQTIESNDDFSLIDDILGFDNDSTVKQAPVKEVINNNEEPKPSNEDKKELSEEKDKNDILDEINNSFDLDDDIYSSYDALDDIHELYDDSLSDLQEEKVDDVREEKQEHKKEEIRDTQVTKPERKEETEKRKVTSDTKKTNNNFSEERKKKVESIDELDFDSLVNSIDSDDASGDFSINDVIEESPQETSHRESTTRSQQPEHISSSRSTLNTLSSDNMLDDDDEYVREMLENRRRAKAMREQEKALSKEDKQTAEEKEREYHDKYNSDSFGENTNSFYREASSISENEYDKSGKRKTYYNFLSEEDAAYQKTVERRNEKYGSDIGERYIGKGTGRIILCSSGKGGVGKSLVANGLAMALSLARAKDLDTRSGASTARTWLIESDYNSPQLAVAYNTGNKSLGNIADVLARSKSNVDSKKISTIIEENVHVDKNTGVHILACPPLSSRRSFKEMPLAIMLAIKYASDQGDDVIIDHGNLTAGEYSEFDMVLSQQLANRVILVCNMSCIKETQSVLSLLCERDPKSVIPKRQQSSVSLVLNSAKEEQYYIAQEELAPFEIISMLPPIDAFKPENSLTGDNYLPHAPKEVQKAIIDRCGIMLTKVGYESLRKYFTVKSSFSYKTTGKKTIWQKLTGFIK